MAGRRSGLDVEWRLDAIAAAFSGRIGFAATNLTTGETIARHGDVPMPTASVIKVAVLAEVFRQAAAGRIDLAARLALRAEAIVGGSGILKELAPGLMPTVHDLATLMIVLSDNTATNLLIDLVGGVAPVNRLLHDELVLPSITLYRTIGFTDGESTGPLAEGSATDLAELMARIATGAIAGADASAGMLAILRRQHYLDQVPRYLDYHAYAADLGVEFPYAVASKTGFIPGTWAEAGLLFLPESVVVAYCVLTDGSADRSLAPESEGAVTNGRLGRLLLEWAWPGEVPAAACLASPYLDPIGG